MREELTTAMHSEFTLSDKAQQEDTAFGVFELMVRGFDQADALRRMQTTADQVRPFVALYNKLSAKQVVFE